ncbi:MAG: SGNH/GDSL hydrolase family protein [Ruminococcus flavefaciens]|nr:SGNH/GDSL hydrolase family protein [Ruminococcus flavefaciens]MCM1231078.1 SGNH/GDSL hydrolase family protein [Ruminococcus flavefaciens]
MFRKITSLLSSVVILFGLTGCAMTERDMIQTEYHTEVPPRVLFLGDSIPAGYGLDGYTDSDNYNCESYPNILKEQYTAELADICPHEMQNFAVSGATSDDLLDLIDSGKLDSALESSDAVVISIGGNDMLHIMFGLLAELGMSEENRTIDLENIDIFSALAQLMALDGEIDEALTGFEANLNEISEKLGEKTSGEIYIQTLYNPLETFTDFQILVDFSEEKIGRYNEIVRDNADGYKVIDVAEEFDGRCAELTRIKKLDIHPNEKGHKLIAEIIDSSFRETGFTCTVEEYSEPHLTVTAWVLISVGLLAILLILLFAPRMFSKFKDDETDKKGD